MKDQEVVLMGNPFSSHDETDHFLHAVRQSSCESIAASVLESLGDDHPVNQHLNGWDGDDGDLEYDADGNERNPDPVLELINKIGSKGLVELFTHTLSECEDMDDVHVSGIVGVMNRFDEQQMQDYIKRMGR